jgi:hypothetical protein
VYCGRVTHSDGNGYDCIYFEAFEAGNAKSYTFGQRFRAAGVEEFQALGQPVLLSEDPPLW